MLRGLDSNQRPQGYGPCELPLLYPAIIFSRNPLFLIDFKYFSRFIASERVVNSSLYIRCHGIPDLVNLLFPRL